MPSVTAVTHEGHLSDPQPLVVRRAKFWQSISCSLGRAGVSNIVVGDGPKYWAFISYSHKDAAFGRRLHRRLEGYAMPRRLAARAAAQGAVPRRLIPIFRDREEFSAANDLSTEVRAALLASRSLIVVCSPAAAASPWVTREVETFRALHPDRPVLAAIREGEPPICFPEALRRIGSDGAAVEPLAADFRKGRDGAELALLKLVAGILGIGLDELVQRDAQRRTQRVTAVTAAALIGMLAMGLLTIFALNARSEADRQRNEAEGLVAFMRTDLREKLKGVGRLDMLTAVNQRALQYYDREIGNLTPDSQANRAMLLLALGEDDDTRGDPRAADEFRESFVTTSALVAADPNNPERVFDHAQSVYWTGYTDYERGNYSRTRSAWEAYGRLAKKMLMLKPGEPRYLRELAYAEGDLCTIAFKSPRDLSSAMKLCAASVKHMEEVAQRPGAPADIELDVANRHGWLADVYRAEHDNDRALDHRLIQERIMNRLLAADPLNMKLRSAWIGLQRILAYMGAEAGRQDAALARLQNAAKISDEMLALDPANRMWVQQRAKLSSDIEKIEVISTKRK
jgi:MTH538 TIR-like domain (DUF1863)